MVLKTREYACKIHGDFEAEVNWEGDNLWAQPCPVCHQSSPKRKPVAPLGPAAIHGDVRTPYFSENIGRWVSNKHDLRRYYKESGRVPLSDRDLKDAVEKAGQLHDQTRRDLKWRDTVEDGVTVELTEE